MAAGFVSVAETVLSVTDSSCHALMQSWNSLKWSANVANEVALGCSADPVVLGSKLFVQNGTGGALALSVDSIDATIFNAMDWTSGPHVLQAIYWTLLLVIGLYGYSFGSKGTV